MSSNSDPILVVAKDYFTYHRWLQAKQNQHEYLFVHGMYVLEQHPEANGLLLQDWSDRPDAGEIHQWIELRKFKRETKKVFDNMNPLLNATQTLEINGCTYTLTNIDGKYIAYVNGGHFEYER
jgi:hypothetical protein